jgi:phage-related protein
MVTLAGAGCAQGGRFRHPEGAVAVACLETARGRDGAGLFEVRTTVDGNIYRVLFTIVGSTMVLLHAFMKKTRKTPADELALARRRKKDVEA